MNSESIINPKYDLSQYEKIIEKYEKDSLAYLKQYYTKYFFIDSSKYYYINYY